MTEAERQAALEAIAAEVAVCTRCRLHQTRTRAVPGEGTAATEVLFVGEGPGSNEDRQGRPFVGPAGALLTELLASIGWSRGEVFITNVVKCRPPGNRDPEQDEIAACAPFLTRQLAALDPALVVTLGRFSMARFRPGAAIGQVHGTFKPADASTGAPGALTFSMYHPAAALHQGSLNETLFRDMAGVPSALLEARARQAETLAARTSAEAQGQPQRASASASDPAPIGREPDPDRPMAAQDAPDVEAGELADDTAGAESNPAAQLSLF